LVNVLPAAGYLSSAVPAIAGGSMNTVQHSSLARELVPLLFVDDIQSCIAFYVDKLGFTIQGKWEPDGKPTWCKLRRAGPAIMLHGQERTARVSRMNCLIH
jgi:hypothetical protein